MFLWQDMGIVCVKSADTVLVGPRSVEGGPPVPIRLDREMRSADANMPGRRRPGMLTGEMTA